LGILEQALRDGLESVLVMEDDLSFAAAYPEMEKAALDVLCHHSWGLVYFGCGGFEAASSEFGMQAVPPTQPLKYTHFYGVHHDLLVPLVSFLHQLLTRPPGSPEGGPMHVDGAYQTFRERNHDFTTLVAYPSLGFQRRSRQDIHALRWFDRTPLISRAAECFRSVTNWCEERLGRY